MSYFVKDLAERLEASYQWWREHKDEAASLEMKVALQKRAIEDQYDLMSHILEYLDSTQGSHLVSVPRLVGRGDLTRIG